MNEQVQQIHHCVRRSQYTACRWFPFCVYEYACICVCECVSVCVCVVMPLLHNILLENQTELIEEKTHAQIITHTSTFAYCKNHSVN